MSVASSLASLAAVFAQLSLLAFGGTNSVLPEMQRQVVQVHPWLTAQEFAALLIRTTSVDVGTAAITVVATLLCLFTRLHPLLVLAAAAALGATGLLT
jgi:chromate transporter